MNKRETEPFCLLFDLQWKNNPLTKASIGLHVLDDTSLDSTAFKSYVAQNLGTAEELSLYYVDSDGDELPIESECEFKEAIKLAKQRAKDRREVVLIVDKISRQNLSTTSKNNKMEVHKLGLNFYPVEDSCPLIPYVDPILFLTSKGSTNATTTAPSTTTGIEKATTPSNKVLSKRSSIKSIELSRNNEEPPRWFQRHMKKFKEELLQEMDFRFKKAVSKALEEEKKLFTSKVLAQKDGDLLIMQTKTKKRVQKKKKSDEESSAEGFVVLEHRDCNLLKKIEKLNRSGEKKFEKLDSKLGKLENRTKRLLEKKSQSKSKIDKKDKTSDQTSTVELKPSNDIAVTCSLMDATLLEKPPLVHIHPGRSFLKNWYVMNNGTLPWTDKTELCLAWGTPGLQFDKTVIKCPRLKPGQKGRISVRGQAPNYSGTFECYWHFHHMGERFGHWIDCNVIVEAPETSKILDNRKEFVFTANNDALIDKIQTQKKAEVIYEMAKLTENLNLMRRNLSECSQKIICLGTCNHTKQKDEASNTEDYNTNEVKAVASETVKENQRKIEATIVKIRKMLDDITLMPVPPTKDKILEMVGVDEFASENKKQPFEETDNLDDLIDIDCITGKNIEPAEWRALQLHPEFMKCCDMLRKISIKDDFSTSEEVKHAPKENDDLINFSVGGNDLDKPQPVSESFTRNIPDNENVTDVKVDNIDDDGGKHAEYESESDSELSVISTFSASTEPEDDENFIVVSMPNNTTKKQDCTMCRSSEAKNLQELQTANIPLNNGEMNEHPVIESAPALPAEKEAVKNDEAPKEETSETFPPENLVRQKKSLENVNSETPVPKELIPKESSPERAFLRGDNSEEVTLKVSENLKEFSGVDSNKRNEILTVDSKGQIIYAVKKSGCCYPVESLLDSNYKDTPTLRRTRLEESDRNESQTKKMKSSKANGCEKKCHFVASPSKIFCAYPPESIKSSPGTSTENTQQETPSTFTFTAKQQGRGSCPVCCNTKDKRVKPEKFWRQYLKRNSSYYPPADYSFSERKECQQSAPAVDILPNSLMHGAFNVASSAFNTAISVFNNLQSALSPEAKASQPGGSTNENTNKEFSFDAMYRLYEMGFTDVAKNRKLLFCHNNDLYKVIEDLVTEACGVYEDVLFIQ